jgi:hypothetical protein
VTSSLTAEVMILGYKESPPRFKRISSLLPFPQGELRQRIADFYDDRFSRIEQINSHLVHWRERQ